MLIKVAQNLFIFGPSSVNHFPSKINFSLDLSLKNCTLGGRLFPPWMYIPHPVDYENRPNFYRSRLKIDVHA